MRLIVPAYFYPSSGSEWDTLIAGPGGIGYVVVNDRSGVLAGQTVDASYTTALTNARGADLPLLYYVHTSYATRPVADVTADMDAWVSLYGQPTGWFIDEAATNIAANLDYYSELYRYAAGRRVVLNFGTDPSSISDLHLVCDTAIIFENTAAALASWTPPSGLSSYDKDRFGVIIHDAADGTALSTAWSTISSNWVGWAFVGTSSTYAALPSYWSTERALIPAVTTSLTAPEWGWEPGVAELVGGSGGASDLVATLTETTLTLSPGSIVAKVANGSPDSPVAFTIAGSTAPTLTVVLDATGAASGVSVPVNVATAGTYTLSATDGLSTATVDFTVSFIELSGGFVVPTLTPPDAVQNTTGVKKWVFQDPAGEDVYHFAYNPDNMTSPFGPKNITYQATTAIDGQKLAFEGQQAAVQWQFSGNIRTQAAYDEFVYWFNKRNRIWITDHYGRAWSCYLTQFQPVPRRSVGVPWSHTYTMSVLIFDGPVTPV